MPPKQAVSRRDDNVEDLSLARARRGIREGSFDDMICIFSKPWRVRAKVEHGDARGRTIGFPTANLHLDPNEAPAFGIYAVRVRLLDNRSEILSQHHGVANFGIRPMFRTDKPLLEVHLFDFADDIYGWQMEVELVAWLRPEAKFPSLGALVAQIHADAVSARAILEQTV